LSDEVADKLLTFDLTGGKVPRYYQRLPSTRCSKRFSKTSRTDCADDGSREREDDGRPSCRTLRKMIRVQKAFKVTLQPAPEEVLINKTIGCARFVYNSFWQEGKSCMTLNRKHSNTTDVVSN